MANARESPIGSIPAEFEVELRETTPVGAGDPGRTGEVRPGVTAEREGVNQRRCAQIALPRLELRERNGDGKQCGRGPSRLLEIMSRAGVLLKMERVANHNLKDG